MAWYLFSVQLLLLVSLTSTSHYYGGFTRYVPKGRNLDGSFQVDLHFKQTFRGCNYYSYWGCYHGNCGNKVASELGLIDSSTNGWCETENVETRHLPSDDPFEMRKASCCWVPKVNGPGSWKLLTHVDLRRRSDTWQSNNSPNNAILPFLRYGSQLNHECAACNQPSGFYLDEGQCILHYKFTSYKGLYGFELVVEDFPRSTITLNSTNGSQTPRSPLTAQRRKGAVGLYGYGTTPSTTAPSTSTPNPWKTTTRRSNPAPLSKLPLQFSLIAAPSCHEGEYLPKFVQPTPRHGERLKAQVNEQFEMKVKAQASHSSVGDIIFSGPLKTTKHRISQGQFYIRWTPTEDHLGEQVPICFIAEAAFSSQKFQSEMRCILVDVEHATAHVICNETSMTVELNKSSFKGLSEDHLRLNDPSNTACSLQSNGTHVIGVIPLNACGTQIEEDDENLIFKNEITTFDDVSDIITRKHLLEVQFSCHYPKHGNVTLGFTVHRDNLTVVERGFGTFTYNFEFFPDNQFGFMVDPSSYPLEYDVGEKIYMQIEATSSVNNTELFVESCRASPYDNPNYQPTYSIIENGCTVDPTVVIYSPSHNKEFHFSIDAFKFIGLHDQVYISCSVILCEAGNPDTRCTRGCVPPTPMHHRRKRAAVIETGAHFISQGPLRLRGTQESRVTGLNLNLAFIAGCLLAAIAMICGVMIHKFKRADTQ
ncbi:hypothetical protein CRUP_034348 [Coryphaenoides rupestris]|nr:hypothetical protein CRUP_034348 [Coryphaenoides rupestris]